MGETTEHGFLTTGTQVVEAQKPLTHRPFAALLSSVERRAQPRFPVDVPTCTQRGHLRNGYRQLVDGRCQHCGAIVVEEPNVEE